jgi:hypothetical protein
MAIIVTLPPTNNITVNETAQTVNVSTAASTVSVATTGIAQTAFSKLTDVTATTPYTKGHFVSVGSDYKLKVNNTLRATTNPDRPVFEYLNSDAGPNSAIVLKKTYNNDPTTGDGTGIRFELAKEASNYGYQNEWVDGIEYASLQAVWSPTAPSFTMATSINDGTSYQNVLTANKDLVTFAGDIKVGGNDIYDSSGARAISFTTNAAGDPIIKLNRDKTYNLGVASVVIDDRIELNTSVITTTSTATAVLDQWTYSTIRSGKYMIQISTATNWQIWEGMVIHDGVTTKINAYGDLRTAGVNLAVITAAINTATNKLELRVTPTSATSTTFKAMKTLIYV